MDDYLKEADWIGESHPLAFSLAQVALALDKKDTIAMRREFNSLIRTIEAMKPTSKEVKKKVDPLLRPAQGPAAVDS